MQITVLRKWLYKRQIFNEHEKRMKIFKLIKPFSMSFIPSFGAHISEKYNFSIKL